MDVQFTDSSHNSRSRCKPVRSRVLNVPSGIVAAIPSLAQETIPILRIGSSDKLSDFLVAANGKTLYMFKNDTAGVSNCYNECAQNWPPLLVAGSGISGELGTIKRADDRIQVTYNGMPLYFWKDDRAPGDTTGQGVGDVWFVVAL